MAELSDQLLVVAILGYLTAMICYAAQYAFGERGLVARVAARPAQEPAAASPRASMRRGPPFKVEPEQGTPPQENAATGALGRSRPELPGRVALAALLLAAAAHLTTAVTRGIAAERVPWANMYEFILSATLITVIAWLVVLFRYPSVRHLSLYVSLINVILLGIAGMPPVYTPVAPLMPALDSYWFLIHVAAAATASGIFLVGFVTAVMYLLRAGFDRGRRNFPYQLGARVPAADALERLTFRLHAFAFPIWTFAVIAGAIWAEASWGRYWAWDPKEVWAFITWVVYAAYLHARATPSVQRRTAVWLAIVGLLTVLMNLFGVNLLFDSLHSYA